MGLDVFLQVLRTLEGLATKVTLVRLQRDVDSDMRGDVVALDDSSAATAPFAGQVEVVGALTANMALTHMFVESLCSRTLLSTTLPQTRQLLSRARCHRNGALTLVDGSCGSSSSGCDRGR